MATQVEAWGHSGGLLPAVWCCLMDARARRKADNCGGFTLVELMITLVIIVILATIAYPSFQNYIIQGRARTASSDLMALATDLENNFQRTLSYTPATTTDTASTRAATIGWSPAEEDFFNYTMISVSTGYTLTASGNGMMNGCVITLDQDNARTASEQCLIPSGW